MYHPYFIPQNKTNWNWSLNEFFYHAMSAVPFSSVTELKSPQTFAGQIRSCIVHYCALVQMLYNPTYNSAHKSVTLQICVNVAGCVIVVSFTSCWLHFCFPTQKIFAKFWWELPNRCRAFAGDFSYQTPLSTSTRFVDFLLILLARERCLVAEIACKCPASIW